MRMPAASRAFVDASKVRDYLLSEFHPVGRSKAALFRALGYSPSGWQDLALDLRRHALENEVAATQRTPYGVKHRVRGRLAGPRRSVVLVTVWIVLDGEDFPRFVTAFPAGRP